MKINLRSHSNNNNVLPNDLYELYLETINGKFFTRREIDIIACILSGKTVKKIALFLSISPRTVENHIRNLTIKLGCNAQAGIIDFIEKSGKFILVKKHYINLFIHNAFKNELKKISLLIKKTETTCLVLYRKEHNTKASFIFSLITYLKILGINVFLENIQNQKTVDLNGTQHPTSNDFILCYISPSEIEQLLTQKSDKYFSESDFIQSYICLPQPIIFLSLNNEASCAIDKTFDQAKYIDLAQTQNYYFLVFELLKKLFPSISINKNLSEFKKQYEAFSEPSFTNALKFETDTTQHKKTKHVPFVHDIFKKKWLTRTGVFCLCLLSLVLLTISKHSSEILNISSRQASQSSVQSSSNTCLEWNLPRQDNIFIGRAQLLSELETKLQPLKLKNKKPDPHNNLLTISAATGLGGIGKTQLALYYVHNTKHPYTLRAWFPAENINQLRQKYVEFANRLGYAQDNPSFEDAIVYVNKWLSQNPGWLLVYDNVNSYKEIEPFLPEGNGHVLITTRMRCWPDRFQVLPIDVMSEQESIHFLKTLTHHNNNDEINEIRELAKSLGHLPLALAQAGAYIHQSQISVSDYLTLYKKHEIELLSDTISLEGTNHLSVQTTWNISLNKLAKEAIDYHEPLYAIDLLMVCAYLAPEKIPRQLLLMWFKQAYPKLSSHELVLAQAIRQLWKYSLICTDEEGNISIHRLMQVVLRNHHKQELRINNSPYPSLSLQWYNNLLDIARQEFNRNNITVLESENTKNRMFPHLQTLVKHYNALWPEAQYNPSLISALSDIGWHLNYYLGIYKSAKYYFETALSLTKLDPSKQNIQAGTLLSHLGNVYRKLKEHNAAQKVLELALKTQELECGSNNYQLVSTLVTLGSTYRNLENYHKSKKILERALSITEQKFGTDDIHSAPILSTLGNTYRNLREYNHSLEALERSLNILEHVYGKNHREIAPTLVNFGATYYDMGDFKKSELFLQRAWDIDQREFGKEHPRIAIILSNFAQMYRLKKEFEKAKIYLLDALQINEKEFGADHPHIAFTLNTLGDVYRNLKEFSNSTTVLERALHIIEKNDATNHRTKLAILENLSFTFRDMGNAERSEEFLKKASQLKGSLEELNINIGLLH